MRDLYQRLGVSPQANDEELQHAVARCPNSALRQDAKAVFEVPKHRESYNQTLTTLSDIGQLRARLGLTHGAHWQGDVANDFSLPADQAVSRHDELVDRVSQAVVLYNRLRGLRGIWLLIVTFIVGTGIGVGLGFTLSQTLAA
ncbi:hypothetical protein [Vreelandella populi]|uniref:Uncharacterized protein n=1 Tax=Vreelandella populi TaxID=2498858 RepID=A0A3S0WN79_9GAMM|nr:hypothetical protein [Halomonas populi]RUR39223.1 hypothetical protein ELY25_06165 [Halomonas populi]RUR46335.1 hypothetical protein ELY37_10165 [Halomonas populi]RUR53159.1 hypothetical protein ELY40_14145 [Halomonas populi]